jgi:hypothetical protein
LDIDLEQAAKLGIDPLTLYQHEIGHWLSKQYGDHNVGKIMRQTFYDTPIDKEFIASYPENFVDELLAKNPNVDHSKISKESSAAYMLNQQDEAFPFLREMRQNMINKGYINDEYDDISEATINKFIKENPDDRISSFTESDSKQSKVIHELFKNLPAVIPATIGLGMDLKKEQKREGGIIKDDRGQWDHPGKITRIKGGKITMKKDPKTGKALTEPLLGIADTGEQQWMYPGKDYTFEGANYVTEIPKRKLAKNGMRQEQKGLVNLDNLLNFTNYNKPQPGGWLSKYE